MSLEALPVKYGTDSFVNMVRPHSNGISPSIVDQARKIVSGFEFFLWKMYNSEYKP